MSQRLSPISMLHMTAGTSKNLYKVSHIADLVVITIIILSQLPLKSDGSIRAYIARAVKSLALQ